MSSSSTTSLPMLPDGLGLGAPITHGRPHAHTISEAPVSVNTIPPPTKATVPGPPVISLDETRERADSAPAAIKPIRSMSSRSNGAPSPGIVSPGLQSPNNLSPLAGGGGNRDRSASIASSSMEDVQGDGNVPSQRQKEFEKHFAAKLASSPGKLTSPSTASLASTSSSLSSGTHPLDRQQSNDTLSPLPEDYLTVLSTRGADLQASILVHGRLYLTKYHLCFRSNILGIKTVNIHPLSSLVEVRAGTTAKFIKNAVYIKEDGEGSEKVGYGSMSDRDGFLECLIGCWKARAPGAYDAYMTSVAEGAEEDVTAGASNELDADDSTTVAGGAKGTDAPSGSTSASSEIKHTKDSGQRYKELAIDTKFPVTPEQLFQLIYQNMDFTMEFMEKDQKLKEVKVGDWNGKKRTLTFIMSITNPIGPNETHSTSIEEEDAADADKAYEILSETKNPDLPSGKNFSIKTRTCITHTDVNGKPGSRFVSTTQVDWTASSMLKGKITTASIAGQKEYHQKLAKKLRSWIKAHPEDFGKVAGEGADAGEGEDDSDEQYGEDTKEDIATQSSGGGSTEEKTWMDYASDLVDNPVLAAIVAFVLTFALIGIYSVFARHPVIPIRDHVDLKHAKKILSSEPMARLEQLERLLGLESVAVKGAAVIKGANKAAKLART